MSRRDRIKFEQWQNEKEFARFSDLESERFESAFREKLTRDRFTLLLKNPLERCAVMMASLNDWAGVNSDILTRDSKEAGAVFEKMEQARRQMKGLKPVIQDTMDGASRKIKNEIGKEVDGFLDTHYGTVINNIQGFVRRYEPDYERIGNDLEGMGFSSALYMVFQDFKREVDLFMSETVNPALIQFIRQEEQKIIESLDRTSGSYDALIQNTLQRYKETVKTLGISSVEYTPGAMQAIDREDLRKRAGLNVPPLVSPLRYTARVRAEAVMSLGFYNSIKMIKKLFKQQIQDNNDTGIRALRDGVKRIKQETERSIIFNLSHYKENLKFQY
ncbi:MAG: hypothetical protein IH593_07220, partial [Bacteroidales bacterium]|nr:hypothetical protein [Bacteroidales bacterium]